MARSASCWDARVERCGWSSAPGWQAHEALRALVLAGTHHRREELWPVKIRAAVLEEFGKPLNVTEVDLAEPRQGEVLVRLEACGVCHTDMYTASGADPSGY